LPKSCENRPKQIIDHGRFLPQWPKSPKKSLLMTVFAEKLPKLPKKSIDHDPVLFFLTQVRHMPEVRPFFQKAMMLSEVCI
jgi:hypothetical protein